MYHGSHKGNILSILSKDRVENDSYCDVTLEVEDKKISAHKCVIGRLSPYFHKMFKTEMKEKYTSSICLKEMKYESIEIILDFMYTANIRITNENVMEILKISDYLELNEVKLFCVDYLKKSIDHSNCLQYHALGRTFDAQSLINAAVEIVVKNFKKVSKNQEFKELDKKDLFVIIENVEEKTSVMKSVFKALIAWIKHDLDNRKQHLVDLLKLIKLHLLPTSFLEEVVANESLVKESNECLQYFVSELLHRLKQSKTKDDESSSSSSDTSVDEGSSSNECTDHNHVSMSRNMTSSRTKKIVFDPVYLASFKHCDKSQVRPKNLPSIEDVMRELFPSTGNASASTSFPVRTNRVNFRPRIKRERSRNRPGRFQPQSRNIPLRFAKDTGNDSDDSGSTAANCGDPL